MRVDHIHLVNFRGFEDFQLDLHPEMTLLVGDNGSGKTAIIDGLALSLSLSSLGTGGFKPVPLDVRCVAHVLGGVVDLRPQTPASLSSRPQRN